MTARRDDRPGARALAGPLRHRLRSRRDGERGAVLVLVAITLSALFAFTSLAIDIGFQRVVRRDMQAVSDVVALDLARRINGSTADTILNDPAFLSAIGTSRDRNDFAAAVGRTITVELGVLDPLTNQLVSAMATYTRVGTGAPAVTTATPAGIPDAVRVTAKDTVDYFFRPGSGTASRSAVTTIDAGGLASFSTGSFLLAVDPASNSAIGQVLNSVAPGASVLSYAGLVDAQVTLGELMVPLGVGSVDEVLSTQVSFRDLVVASITALAAQGGQTAAITVLNGLLTGASTVENITIGDLFGADLSGGSPPASATVNVLSLLTSAVYLSDGQHFITLDETVLNIPAVTQVTVDLTVIEPPQFGGFTVGATASTGQFELTITPTFNFSTSGTTTNICTLPSGEKNLLNSLLGGVLNLLGCVLTPLNRLVTLNVNGSAPMAVTAAGATTTLTDIDCENPAITLDPGPVPFTISSTANLTIDASVAGSPIGDLFNASLVATAGGSGSAAPQTFLHPSEFGSPRRVGAAPLGLAGLLGFTASDVTVVNVNLGTLASRVVTPAFNAVNGLLGSVDSLVIGPVARTLGLSLGGTDLTALSLDCERGGGRLVG